MIQRKYTEGGFEISKSTYYRRKRAGDLALVGTYQAVINRVVPEHVQEVPIKQIHGKRLVVQFGQITAMLSVRSLSGSLRLLIERAAERYGIRLATNWRAV